jgi:hypothetical protein
VLNQNASPSYSKGTNLEQAKRVAYGFVGAASIIALFVSAVWLLTAYLNLWIGMPVFLFLAVPFSTNCIRLLKRLNGKKPPQTQVKQAKNILMALPGAGVACWFFDVLSTVLVLNIAQSGTELNPLGWPYSAPAALAYYIPIAFITYYLLFKIKKKISFYAAVAVSTATLFMAARSFLASLNNFGPDIIAQYSPNPTLSELEILCIWIVVVVILALFNIALAQKTIHNRKSVK